MNRASDNNGSWQGSFEGVKSMILTDMRNVCERRNATELWLKMQTGRNKAERTGNTFKASSKQRATYPSI
jgi:hypothetical protein